MSYFFFFHRERLCLFPLWFVEGESNSVVKRSVCVFVCGGSWGEGLGCLFYHFQNLSLFLLLWFLFYDLNSFSSHCIIRDAFTPSDTLEQCFLFSFVLLSEYSVYDHKIQRQKAAFQHKTLKWRNIQEKHYQLHKSHSEI